MNSRNIILDAKALRAKVDYYLDQPMFAFDSETMGDNRGDPVANQVVWLSFATKGDAFALPIGHPNGDKMLEPARKRKDPVTKKFNTTEAIWSPPPRQIRPAEAFEILEPLLFHPEIGKAGSGLKFDVLTFAKYYDGRLMPGPFHDTLVADWLLNENRLHGLKEITKRRYGRAYDKENVGRRVEIHPFWKVARYAMLDSRFAWLHINELLDEIAEQGLQEIYDLEMDLFKVLCSMEHEGTPVNEERIRELQQVLGKRRDETEARVYKTAGKVFNIKSNPQKVQTFYGPKSEGNQGLKPWKLTKGGLKKRDKGLDLTLNDYSTDKESLEQFAAENDLVKVFLEFQEVDRILGTYIEGYAGVPGNPKKPRRIFGGKVFPDFVQYGTVTGRFSCREPNLQNIPRPDTDLGKQVRSLFVAGQDHKLVVADYGQIELVVLAHFVGKGALYEGFFQGIDPHTMTAAMVFQHDPEVLQRLVDEKDPEAKAMRQAAKAINFAVVYGAGPEKVAAMAGVKVRRAKQILGIHQDEFPEIYRFKDQCIRVAKSRKPPHLTTLMGRKRRVPAVMSRDWGSKGRAERQLVNSLIQGSAADLIKLAMIRVHEGLEREQAGKLLLTVHDELVVRSKDDMSDRCAEIVQEAMTGAGIQKWVKVPLSIDLNVVDNWAEAK